MFPLWRIFITTENKKREKPSPIPEKAKQHKSQAQGNEKYRYIEGIPQFAALTMRGSMTVEAAIVIPLFLFFFLNLLSAVEMIRLHGKLQLALWEQGKLLSVVGYLAEGIAEELVSDITEEERQMLELGGTLLADCGIKSMVIQELGREYLDESPLTYGADGLRFIESSYVNDDCVDIKVTYQVSPVFALPGFDKFRMSNRYYARSWTGYAVGEADGDKKEEDFGEVVYVTVHGEVYHITLDCRYLKRMIQVVQADKILTLKNQNGEDYSPCELCIVEGEAKRVYVTPDGRRYHSTVQCGSLKRTIQGIRRMEAEKRYRACSGCAGG